MPEGAVNDLRNNMMAIGRLLWEKDLVSGLNGNISHRVSDQNILLTAHSACLGFLQEKSILPMLLDGTLPEGGQISTEKLLHTEIYKNFPEIQAIIHTHTAYATGYFLANETFVPQVFEAKFYLGEVHGVAQTTPAVTDMNPVLEVLKRNNIVVLRNHGVVAMGKNLFDCFLLIQALEEAIKIDSISRLYSQPRAKSKSKKDSIIEEVVRYKLFSQEQMDKIVEIVNQDASLKELGKQTRMTMDLAVKLNDTGQTYSFSFEDGRITKFGKDENAEFLVSAPAEVWRQVFNREIDPFVATTQKKMHLRGDFARISRWYAPCSRVFELWQQVPVE